MSVEIHPSDANATDLETLYTKLGELVYRHEELNTELEVIQKTIYTIQQDIFKLKTNQ